jgi:MFS family permease
MTERPGLRVEKETLSALEKPASTNSAPKYATKAEAASRHISLQSMVDSIASEEAYHLDIDRAPPMPPINHAIWSTPSSQKLLNSTLDLEKHNKDDGSGEEPNRTVPQPSKLIEMSTMREIMFVGVCAVSHLMTQAALGQALVPIDIIAESFGNPSPGELSWFIAGYSLTVGTFIMISGQLGDIFGHKRVFAFGYAWLGVWSCFTGFAAYVGSEIYFDVCRAMQGIGPALLMPNALALFGRTYAPGSIRKNIVFSIFGALAPAGFVIGGTFGSLFAQLAWWPWGFWSYGVTAFCLAAFSLLAVPKALSDRPVVRPVFDAAGSLLVVAGLVLVNVAFNNGPLYGWHTPHVYFIVIMGLMCLGGFIWVERRAVNPLLPIHALNSTVGFVLTLVGLGWGAFGVWVFYTVQFLQHIRGETPLTISAQFSPAIIAGLVAAGLTGALLTHTPVSFVMMLSMMAFCAGVLISTFQAEQQVYWAQTFVSIVVMPFGMDMSFPAATVILSNYMPREHQGLAASLVNTVVNYSISIALGIAGTVEVYAAGSGDPVLANQNAHYTAVGLAGMGVLLGILFFVKSLVKEGWRVMGH